MRALRLLRVEGGVGPEAQSGDLGVTCDTIIATGPLVGCMPYADHRAGRLYYDESCGPCRLMARAAEGLSGHQLTAVPLAAQAAEEELRDLAEEDRFGSAHLVNESGRHTGAALTTPLLAYTLGPSVSRIVAGVPFLDRAMKGFYHRLWSYRRTRGCAAPH